MSDSILAMRSDIFLEIVPRTKRRRTTRKDIMLTLQRMMNLPGSEPEETMKILQVMKNMFLFELSQVLFHMGATIGL